MIKADQIIVKIETIENRLHIKGVLSIVVQHDVEKQIEHVNPDVIAKLEEATRNAVLRYMYEDMVPIVHDMGKLSMPYLPTHLQVQMNSHMDHLMDIFLGLEPGQKH